jgi:hypothetical protein
MAAALVLIGWTSCAFAQGTKDPSNPVVAYPTNPQRPLAGQPRRPRYLNMPNGTGDGTIRLQRAYRVRRY